MADAPDREDYRIVRQLDLSGGVNDYLNQALVGDNQTPDCLNVEFDRGSVDTAQGSIKFNNQTAPASSILCKSSKNPMAVMSQPLAWRVAQDTTPVEVPMQGYAYIPYNEATDIGGDFAYESILASSDPYNRTYHNRRGKSFEFNVSFRVPQEERFFEAPATGSNPSNNDTQTDPGGTEEEGGKDEETLESIAAPAITIKPPNGFDEALDECFMIIQKGGDRTSPMSWALGIVNIGTGAGLELAPQPRPTNYALVFMWYDSAGWGHHLPTNMRYSLDNGNPTVAGKYSTQAYRAIVIHRYVETGKTYHVAVKLQLDSGSPGTTQGVAVLPTFAGNGYFQVHVQEEHGAFSTHSFFDGGSSARVGLEILKGPIGNVAATESASAHDSLRYLCRYGIRYSGKDPIFLGLGQRFTPWDRAGFVPFGADCAPMRAGGYSMADRTVSTVLGLYGPNYIPLNTSHSTLDRGFIKVSHLVGNAASGPGNYDPAGVYPAATLGAVEVAGRYLNWEGLGASTGIGAFNEEALRGYRLAYTAEDADLRGAVLTILNYEIAPNAGFNVLGGTIASNFPSNWTSVFDGGVTDFPALIQAFRWNQRSIEIGQVKFWKSPRDYTSTETINGVTQVTVPVSRRRMSLGMSLDLRDVTEPDINELVAYWPCSDSEGGTLEEKIIGGPRNGFLAPLGNVISKGGGRGENMMFLSGEGEALTLDLSENSVFQRELLNMLRDDHRGFGFEITFVPTEAFYGLYTSEPWIGPNSVLGNGSRPAGVPDLVTWEYKEDGLDRSSMPRPLLTLGHRGFYAYAAQSIPTFFQEAQAFHVEVGIDDDNDDKKPVQHLSVAPWYIDGATSQKTSRYGEGQPWVGKRVTLQVGIVPASYTDSFADEYDVYIALKDKESFKPEVGDIPNGEFTYYSQIYSPGYSSATNYYSQETIRIPRKQLMRSVLTIGGRWNCKANRDDARALGIHEISARMLVDEIRWFGTSPGGALPSSSGRQLYGRNGKLEGQNCLPPRELVKDDLRQPLGEGVTACNVVRGKRQVTTASTATLYSSTPAENSRAILNGYLEIEGDVKKLTVEETIGTPTRELYFIESVAANAQSLQLGTAYAGNSRDNATAYITKLFGYLSFATPLTDNQRLYLGKGEGYDPAIRTVNDVIMTQALYDNETSFGGQWKLRIYSPLSSISGEELFPSWTRGLATERRYQDDGILGLHGFNDKIYAGVRGSLYEADDRWRDDGPTSHLTSSLEFRAKDLFGRVRVGEQQDRVEFTNMATGRGGLALEADTNDAYAYVFDWWGKLNQINEVQGVAWLGDPSSYEGVRAQRPIVSGTGSAADLTYGKTSLSHVNYAGPGDDAEFSKIVPGVYIQAGSFVGQVSQVVTATATTLVVNVYSWFSSAGISNTGPAAGTGYVVFLPGHKTNFQLRYVNGYPQLALGSAAQYDDGAATQSLYPEKGLYTATSTVRVSADEWHHVRFVLPSVDNGTWWRVARCYVNGKKVDVATSHVQLGAVSAGDDRWLYLDISSATGQLDYVKPSSTSNKLVLGCLRDGYAARENNFGTQSRLVPPRYAGWMHSLDGRLANVAISKMPFTADYEDFDPYSISYQQPGIAQVFNGIGVEGGIGHCVYDQVSFFSGAIISHPFVSVFHEMGNQSKAYSFAEYGSQLFATNGYKPVLVVNGKGQFAGVPPPLAELDFTTERTGLWRLSQNASFEQWDPISSGRNRYHMNNVGNCYLSGDVGSAMVWSSSTFFGFKLLWKPRRVDGRNQIFRRGTDANNGGPFVDCVDGKIRIGWYDIGLKKEVWVETDGPVVKAGQLNYLHVRKSFPIADQMGGWGGGNWRNSYLSRGRIRRVPITCGINNGLYPGQEFTATGAADRFGRVVRIDYETYPPAVGTAGVMEFVIYENNAFWDTLAISTVLTGKVIGTIGSTGGPVGEVTVTGSIIRPMNDICVARYWHNEDDQGDWWKGAGVPAYSGWYYADPLQMRSSAGVDDTGNPYTPTFDTPLREFDHRCFTSFTTDEYAIGSSATTNRLPNPHTLSTWRGFKATGLISLPETRWIGTGTAGELKLFYDTTSGSPPTPLYWPVHDTEAEGCIFEFADYYDSADATASAYNGKQYLVYDCSEPVGGGTFIFKIQLRTVLGGTAPTFPTDRAMVGGVFIGTRLVKSQDFDESTNPDTSQQQIQLFGSSNTTDYQPFDAEMFSFGYVMAPANAGNGLSDAYVFEYRPTKIPGGAPTTDANDDPILVGGDTFFSNTVDLGRSSGAFTYNPLRYLPGTLHFHARSYTDDTFSTLSAGEVLTGTQHTQVNGVAYDLTVSSTWPLYGYDTMNYVASSSPIGNRYWQPPTTTQPNTQVQVSATSWQTQISAAYFRIDSTGGPESSLTWRYIQPSEVWLGKRYIAVAFYDPIQGVVGNASPILEVDPAGNDVSNDAGPIIITLTNIPTGPKGCEVWVYCSVADGNAGTLYRVAKLANGTGRYSIEVPDDQIVLGPPLEFNNYEPPRCDLVASSKSRMLYGALAVQPDGISPSRVGLPGAVDFLKTFRIQGGNGDRITGMCEFDGFFVAAKRRALASVDFAGDNFAVPDLISSGVGCIAHPTMLAKDNLLFFMSDRGLQVCMRRGVTNLAEPQYIGDNVSTFVQDDVDSRALVRAYAAVNRKRNQYTLSLKGLGEDRQSRRITLDLTDEGPVYSLYRLPNVTALASVQSKSNNVERLVGGTEEGFVVWMDREETPFAMRGQQYTLYGTIYGKAVLQVFDPVTGYGFRAAYPTMMDRTLEGWRGVTASYVDADGTTREVPILSCQDNIVHFDRPLPAPIPASATLGIGGVPVYYETPWAEMGNSETRKVLMYINFVFGKEQDGEVIVKVYTDWDSDNVKAEATLDLTQTEHEVTLSGVDGRWFKVSVESAPLNVGLKFTLSSITYRLIDTDQV